MAPAYRSVEDGQVVVSDEPRPDLENLARWEEIPVPDVVESIDPTGEPVILVGEPVAEDDSTPPAVVVLADGTPAPVGEDGIPVLPVGDPAADTPAEPVPSEEWTHAQLDEYAAAHGVDVPSTAKTKADKLALLT